MVAFSFSDFNIVLTLQKLIIDNLVCIVHVSVCIGFCFNT